MTFKVRLLLGAAAPLVVSLPAFAQVSISTATTAPVQTATANAGAASDVNITTAGAITLATPNTTAVTINSNNDVTNAGTIAVNNINNGTGVRILPGFTGSYTGTGPINLIEDYTRTDTDNDGDLDGPLAQGTGRTGILVEPGGTFTGDLRLGIVTVEGNDSYGVSVRSVLDGNYVQKGAVALIGSNTVGLDFRENVTGNVQIGGTVAATGENAVGVRMLGDVGGEFLIDGAVASTGFAQGNVSNYEDPDTADTDDLPPEPAKLDADDLLVGGSAVEIRGDLAFGLLVNGAAVGGVDPTPDVKDVVQDFNENRSPGAVSVLGSAPAMVIQSLDGAAGDAIVLSPVRETILDTLDDDDDDNTTEQIGQFTYQYGLMNRGSILSNGVNIGFSSTGLKVAGSADGTHSTTVLGGIYNGGAITSTAFEADSLALQIGSGASTPQILNIGTIRADVTSETDDGAWGVRVDAGASVPTVTNNGLILAVARGYDANPTGFQDLSGTVTTFTNTSRVVAGYQDDDTTDDITSGLGRAVAIDLSHSAGGVHLTQQDTVDNARIIGDVLLGAGSDRIDLLSGDITGNVDFGGGADTLAINSAVVAGNVSFAGSGADISIANTGAIVGNINLGSAATNLSITGSSAFNGAITRTGAATAALTVDNSIFNSLGDGTLNLSSMALSNNARVGIAVDNTRVAGNVPNFNVSGAVNIGADTRFTPIFEQFTNQSFTLRVLNGGTVNLGGPLDAMLADNGPFLFNMDLVQPNANAIDLVLSVKTASELGLNTRESDAYSAVLDLLEQDDAIAAALTSVSTAEDFGRSYADLLPGSDASVMRVLASNATAAFGATANRLDMISRKPNAPGGAWTEEFGVYHSADATTDAAKVSGGGFGVAAGVDLLSTGTALIGTYLSLESAELEEDGRDNAPLNVAQTSIGAYAGWLNGNLAINGSASFGVVDFTSDRRVEIGSLSDRLKGSWSGQTYTAAARATYTVPLGWLDVKPYVAADYVGFQQDGYTETGTLTTTGTTDGFAIVAGDSDASLSTASYGLQLTGNFGGDDSYTMRPELSVGYRSILGWESTPATLRFAGGSTGTAFSLTPGNEPEDAILAGFGLNIDSQFLNIKLGYDAEISDNATTHYGSVTLRLAFW